MSFYPSPHEVRTEERKDGTWKVAYRDGREYAAVCEAPVVDPVQVATSDVKRATYAEEQKAARRRQAQLDLYG